MLSSGNHTTGSPQHYNSGSKVHTIERARASRHFLIGKGLIYGNSFKYNPLFIFFTVSNSFNWVDYNVIPRKMLTFSVTLKLLTRQTLNLDLLENLYLSLNRFPRLHVWPDPRSVHVGEGLKWDDPYRKLAWSVHFFSGKLHQMWNEHGMGFDFIRIGRYCGMGFAFRKSLKCWNTMIVSVASVKPKRKIH